MITPNTPCPGLNLNKVIYATDATNSELVGNRLMYPARMTGDATWSTYGEWIVDAPCLDSLVPSVEFGWVAAL